MTLLGIDAADRELIGAGLTGGLLLGTLLACGLPLRFGRRVLPPLPGDIAALLPRNAPERRLCAALVLNAGIGEEIFFRALLPLVAWQITGHAALGVLAATLLFSLAHAYQGPTGLAVTFGLGLLLAGVYVCTRQLWLAVLLHVLINVRTLLVTPWMLERQK